MARLAAAACAALLFSSGAGARPFQMLKFRDQAAEISAAARLLSSYGVITSTFRTVAHNRAVGGVPDSYHLLDRAIDIVRRPGITHGQLDAVLRRAGYSLVESLDERDHSHFAFAAVPANMPHYAEAESIPVPSSSGPPAPPPKPIRRVAADDHGTLALDLQAPAANGPAQVTPQ